MARPGITFEQVAAAADALMGQGLQATINAVRERIGTGSPNTIHKHLTAWRAARPQTAAIVAEMPASLTNAIATEIERAAASARAEVESKLVQVRAEAANAGEALEAERDALLEQVAALTTERDTLAGKAEQQAERIKREQQATEAARVELVRAQLKIESTTEKLEDQAAEIERLRAALETESKSRIAAEQQAAVLTAKLEAMTERATKAEERAEQKEKQTQQASQELSSARNQIQAQQIALDAAARELEEGRKQTKDARLEAKAANEEAAELRGRLLSAVGVQPEAETKPKAKAPAKARKTAEQ